MDTELERLIHAVRGQPKLPVVYLDQAVNRLLADPDALSIDVTTHKYGGESSQGRAEPWTRATPELIALMRKIYEGG